MKPQHAKEIREGIKAAKDAELIFRRMLRRYDDPVDQASYWRAAIDIGLVRPGVYDSLHYRGYLHTLRKIKDKLRK